GRNDGRTQVAHRQGQPAGHTDGPGCGQRRGEHEWRGRGRAGRVAGPGRWAGNRRQRGQGRRRGGTGRRRRTGRSWPRTGRGGSCRRRGRGDFQIIATTIDRGRGHAQEVPAGGRSPNHRGRAHIIGGTVVIGGQ